MRLEACPPFHALLATVPRLRTKLAIRASISKCSSFQSLNWGSWNLASQFFELIFRTCALSLLNSDKGTEATYTEAHWPVNVARRLS